MADDVRRKVEDLIDKARTYGRLVWLDATNEIVLLDTIEQGPEDLVRAEAITNELMRADDLRGVLHAALIERRSKALAEIAVAPPTWDPAGSGGGDAG
jgi:hypothetical protein